MSSLAMATLRDGSQVPEYVLITTTVNLRRAAQESYAALFDLVQKCKDASYSIVVMPIWRFESHFERMGTDE